MKTLRLVLAGLALGLGAAANLQAQLITSPGNFSSAGAFTAPHVTAFDASAGPSGPGAGGAAFGPLLSQPSPGYAEAITPDIQALARGLENDPARIFSFVHDHIRHVVYYGSKKGAELTLLERSGNDFDQCALLVSLLEAAGYTNVGCGFAPVGFPYDSADTNDVHHWFCLNLANTTWTNTLNLVFGLLQNGGYPTNSFFTNSGSTVIFQHIWVTLTIAGTMYYLDPAFKVSQPVAAATNLASAMGLNVANLSTGAGGADTNNYAQGLSETAVRSNLNACVTNLTGYLSGSAPNDSVRQITGGQQIVPWGGAPLPTNLMFTLYTNTSFPLLTWASQPTGFMSTLTVSLAATNQFWYLPQLQGQRLTLSFTSGGVGQLWLQDALQQTNATGSGATMSVALTVTHPYGYWNTSTSLPVDQSNYDASVSATYQRSNATYAVLYAFEASPQMLQARERQLDAYVQQGLSNTSLQVSSETLNVMGLSWMVQTELAEELLARQWGQLPQHHHRFGRMAQETGKGYYVDVYAQFSGTFPSTGVGTADILKNYECFDVASYFWSAMEHGVIEQLQNSNLVAASTVKILQLANATNMPVYLANSTNWSTVSPLLTNYNLSVLSGLIGSNYNLLLPQNGSVQVAGSGSWKGAGYVELLNTGPLRVMGMIIGGGYNGGYDSDPGASQNPPFVEGSAQAQPTYTTPVPVSVANPTGADPVNMADGTFQIDAADLSLGGAEPRGLTLRRHYSTALRFQNPAGMAYGWLHNYYLNAVPASAPLPGLGQTTPQQMVPMLVATCAALNFYNNSAPDPKNLNGSVLTFDT